MLLPVVAADPYTAWGQGRPGEALPVLDAAARSAQRWDAWYDLGLAAAAAGERGRAVAALQRAFQAAPERPEPRTALRALSAAPDSWCDAVGPAGAPGYGWAAVALLAGTGLGLGWWLLTSRRRGWPLAAALACAALAAPGVVARLHDGALPLATVLRDTALLDSTGAPVGQVAAGAPLMREPQPPWNGRALVRTADGGRGWVALADLDGP